MKYYFKFRSYRLLVVLVPALFLSACVSTVVGTAVDLTLEVAKVPFKVVGAAVDVVGGDDKKK